MTTIDNIASQIIRFLSGGNQSKDSVIDRRDIRLRVRQKANALLKLQLLQKREEGDRLLSPYYIATYAGLAIKRDETTKQLYTELPEFFFDLPYNKGLYAVHPDTKPYDLYVRRNNPYVSMSLPCSDLQGQEGYQIEGPRIIYDNSDLKTTTKMTHKLLLAGADKIGDSDPFPLTPDQVSDVINGVITDMQNILKIPEDRVNNNSAIVR